MVHAGPNYYELAREFGCTSWSTRQWFEQAAHNVGGGAVGLRTMERAELTRARWENEQLKQEREHCDPEALVGFVKSNQATCAVPWHVPIA
jgi:transposase-like protein